MSDDTQKWLQLFRDTNALLDGHFVLRSGLHSRQFFQCALVLQHPRHAAEIARALAQNIRQTGLHNGIAGLISPALGGLIIGQELARELDAPRHIFAEKENGVLVLRRGFDISPGQKWIVVEDVITQGGRARETVDIVRTRGAQVAAVAAIVFRGQQRPDFGCPLIALVDMPVETFPPDALPPDLRDTPAIKPGS
jgi:orotate phosphoribosyltransferase